MQVSCQNQIGLRIPKQCPGLLLWSNTQKLERIRLENQYTGHISRRCVDNEKIILRKLPSWWRCPVLKGQTLQIAQAICSQLLSHPIQAIPGILFIKDELVCVPVNGGNAQILYRVKTLGGARSVQYQVTSNYQTVIWLALEVLKNSVECSDIAVNICNDCN